MKKGKLRRCCLMLLAGIMLFSSSAISIFAEDLEETEIACYHYTEETETMVSATSQALMRGAYLASGTVKLTNYGGGSIGIYGSTDANQVCDMLYLDIYLERSTNGSSWSSYDSWGYTKANGSSLTKSFTVTVPTGYYYRLRGYHAAKEGSTKESTSTRTGGKYVS